MFFILENLRGFFSSRPPLVVFMICLGSFAIALITFAYIVKSKDIPNPDVRMDWNTYLDSFSKLEMCLPLNASDQEPFRNSSGDRIPISDLTAVDVYNTLQEMISKTINLPSVSQRDFSTALKKKDPVSLKSQSTLRSTPLPTATGSETDKYFNLTMQVNVEVYLKSLAEAGLITGSTQYIAMVAGRQMTLQGKYRDSERDSELAVTLTFLSNLTSKTCEEWYGETCVKHAVTACVNFQGPAFLFPRTQIPPSSKECVAKLVTLGEGSPVRLMSTQVVGKENEWCKKGLRISPLFTFDDSLTVLLSMEDRTIINLHLMRTSYFLFVMVVTFFCYAMIRGRPAKAKTTHIPYVEKVPTHP